MTLTPSSMLPLGTSAPDFKLQDVTTGRMRALQDLRGGRGLLLMFICNHCPYVKHINGELVKLAHDFAASDLGFAAVSSNDAETYPQDGPEQMKQHAEDLGYPFPYLYDATQSVARAYQAACTPDFFLFDAEMQLVYRGRLDASTPGNNVALDGKDLRAAMEALLEGTPIPVEQHPSVGCNIKWRAA